jgi:BMFP domain-containing protein YqiC
MAIIPGQPQSLGRVHPVHHPAIPGSRFHAGHPMFAGTEDAMPETKSRLADDFARLFNDAAGLAGGVRREIDTLIRSQLDRLLSTMDVVTREEFEAAKGMAAKAREENEALARRISELEARLEARLGPGAGPTPAG